VTRESLYAGIAQARAGNRISDIARAVQETVRERGILGGSPTLLVMGSAGVSMKIRKYRIIFRLGMPESSLARGAWRFAIEPMVNEGKPRFGDTFRWLDCGDGGR